jgi:hypothetical protein
MPEKSKLTKQEISKIYQNLRQTSLKDWTSTALLARMAHETNEETFTTCVENGETPVMKLSPQEMELIRGGLFEGLKEWWARTVENIRKQVEKLG